MGAKVTIAHLASYYSTFTFNIHYNASHNQLLYVSTLPTKNVTMPETMFWNNQNDLLCHVTQTGHPITKSQALSNILETYLQAYGKANLTLS